MRQAWLRHDAALAPEGRTAPALRHDALVGLLLGALLPLPFWLGLRWRFGARRVDAVALLDIAPVVALWLLTLALTGRPLLAGIVAGALPVVIGVIDEAKRRTLEEPLGFTDGTMVIAAIRHPELYLPFLSLPLVLAAVAVGVVALGLMVALDEAVALGAGGAMALAALALLAGAAVRFAPARIAPHLPLARDPARDAARFGPLATFALHAALARGERGARQAAVPPRPAIRTARDAAPHLVLLQMESFLDPRRLDAAAPPDLLPHWDALAPDALARGRLAVPGFGANTNRTEFVVLTGISDEELGLDRLNPYFRFARQPVTSLAWSLRGADYDTVCVHPFDPRFFGRDKVLPALGFDAFETEAVFAGAPRIGRYITDAAVADRIVAHLHAAEGPRFVFAITMQAHGPWGGADPEATWQAHMRDADAMLGTIARAAPSLDRPLLVVAFGDHRPALPFARGGTDTDYLIWRSDRPGDGSPYDLDALRLHRAIRAAAGIG